MYMVPIKHTLAFGRCPVLLDLSLFDVGIDNIIDINDILDDNDEGDEDDEDAQINK